MHSFCRCYVAEDSHLGELVGYVLFFNTVDEKGHSSSTTSCSVSPSLQSSNAHSQLNSPSHATSNPHHDDPIAVIEDLYIKPQYRGYGIATQLWRKVLKVRQLTKNYPLTTIILNTRNTHNVIDIHI